jgi:hypothetical protein
MQVPFEKLRRSKRSPNRLISKNFKGMAGGKSESYKLGPYGGAYKGKHAPKSAW